MSHVANFVTGTVGDKTVLGAISDGSFIIKIDNHTALITGMDFTSDNNYNQIADTIQSSIRLVGVGGYTNCLVYASAPNGNDVTFNFISGTSGLGSYVLMGASVASSGTDLSDPKFLNLINGNQYVSLSITSVDAADMASIEANNASHNDTLSIMIFYNLAIPASTGKCIEMDIVEMPEYQDWYDDLNNIEPFSNRTITTIYIDND